MEERRWLIRTRSKQILGPTSRQKIISLLEQSSLNDDDELSSGNGYWFWVKEKDLVEKYVLQGVGQGFNPISEAETVLTHSDTTSTEEPLNGSGQEVDGQIIPSDEDLEFPDLDATGELEVTSAEEVNTPAVPDSSHVSEEQEGEEDEEYEEDYEEEYEEEEDDEEHEDESEIELEEMPKMRASKHKNDRYLILILVVLCICLACIFFYYRKIINKPIPLIGLISSTHAQSISSGSLIKKKLL